MKKILVMIILAPVLVWGLICCWPGEVPADGFGSASRREVLGQDGGPLAGAEHRMRVAGPWLGFEDLPPVLVAAAMAAEDRCFDWHPGVNPLAVLRAAGQNLMAGRVVSGGSTITMQLARLLNPSPRGMGAKLRQAAGALWLESRLSKREILRQYLNRAPFGGPLVGVGAAARVLLGKHASRLGPAEAALLMSLPKDPSRLLKPSARARLKARRDYILKAMAEAGDIGPDELARALARPVNIKPPPPLPAAAPHFVRRVLAKTGPEGPRRVATHIDPELQKALSGLAAELVKRRGHQGLRQAAIVVLRNSDRAVVAWVGSPDFDSVDGGQVDGVIARRQPGSALKPFVYAMALAGGRTLAGRIDDAPLAMAVDGGAFRPNDYDGEFRGAVSLRVALASSLNLPALRLTAELGPAHVLNKLRDLGMGLPRSAVHYGLGLALGDGEVSLLELAGAYAALADGGRWAAPLLYKGQPRPEPRQVLDPHACRLVADALADDRARALGFGRHSVLELPFEAAVKTGTSQHHRDNWCVGFTGEYTAAVWVGNFQGRPMAGVSGVSGAGPLWRQVMLLLHRHRPGRLPAWPPGITWQRACLVPGKNGGCRAWGPEAFAPGTGPDQADDQPRSLPPLKLTLLTPVKGAIYAVDPDVERPLQILHCRAAVNRPVQKARWRLNGKWLPPGPDPLSLRLPLAPGLYRLAVRALADGDEAWAEAVFRVLGNEPAGHARRTRSAKNDI